ncbi:MAG: alpha/beta hydrolase [Clostridia bacterium]|nr:alpha/beta hydrolase [Clostridia bacterium]
MRHFSINSFDGTPIFVRVWDDVLEPKGVVQIAHGMCEHSGRYDEFASFLEKNGYIVFADDHRCYGQTENIDDIGYHQGEIFEDTLSDLIFLNKRFQQEYSLPVVLFGHSYGSFLSQAFLERGCKVNGVILAGTAYMGKALPFLGYVFASLLPKKLKPAFILKMSDLLFDGAYKPERGPSLWTSSDAEKRKAYLADPMCNIPPSVNFYYNMMKGLLSVAKKSNLEKIDADTPVAIFSGRADPIGGAKSSKAKSLYNLLRDRGVKKVRLFIYENARHELVNEKQRDTYMRHMLSFIDYCFDS